MADRVKDILAQFPGPVTLKPSRRKYLFLLVAGMAFVALAFFDDGFKAQFPVVAWLAIVFFGVCALIGAGVLLPGSGRLTLDSRGFEDVSLFRRRRVLWGDATNFEVFDMPIPWPVPQKLLNALKALPMVAYDDTKQRNSNMGSMSVSISGRTSVLADTYGLSPEQLASVMSRWRELALK